MANCYEKLPHDCGSSDALQIFEDNGKFQGYCFSCATYVPDPYGGKVPTKKNRITKSPEQVAAELEEVASLKSLALPQRQLRKDTLEYFDIKVGVSEVDGKTPTHAYFPYDKKGDRCGYKVKLYPEKIMWSMGDCKGDKDFFGWRQALATGAKRLFITEGEEDAAALFQALKDKQAGGKWADHNPAVVSLTNGSSGVKKDIQHHLAAIKATFKEVVLVFDQDEPGAKAVKDALQLLPSAHSVSMPEKDANACVMNGKSLALANACLFNSSKPKNTRIIMGATLHDVARQQAAYGLSYPWAGLTKLTRGQRFGETYYLGAGVKMGKSTIRSALAKHLITEHGLRVFMAAPEESNAHTYKLMCGQVAKSIFHDPDVPFDYEAYDAASKIIGDKLFLLNLYQHLGWSSLKADIIEAANEGAKAIFIDPITNLTNGIASAEANTVLQEVAQDLAMIALDNELIIWMFCHLKAPENGPPHERGGKVFSNQFAGSRAMMRSCHMMVALEGDKNPDLEVAQKNMRKLVLLEDRQFGASGVIPIFYNENSGTYTEV